MSLKIQELLLKIKNWFRKKPNISGNDFDEIEEEEILKSLDPDFIELLKSYSRKDKENYFVARDERTRLIIRGEYLRTISLIKKIEKLKTLKAETKEEVKIGSRYGI